jgi:starch synthase (maltosyl-transferring)
MRYGFSALFATGVLMPIGFEYGFRRRLHVVKTAAEDWERQSWDITDFIAAVNRLKGSRRVLNEEGALDVLELGNPHLFAFVKWSRDRGERALIVINKDRINQQSFSSYQAGQFTAGAAYIEDLSPAGSLEHTEDFQTCFVGPSGFHVLYAK